MQSLVKRTIKYFEFLFSCMPSKKEFQLIGMQHTRSNVARLLALAEKTFAKRDKIGFELPRDDVNAMKLLYQMLREKKTGYSDKRVFKKSFFKKQGIA